MQISEKIKHLRESHGLTQSQFGAIAGVSDKAVSTWESGTREPRMGAIEKISLYFNIPKSDILFGGDEFPEKAAVPKDDGLSPEEGHLLSLYRGVNEQGQKYIVRQAEFASTQPDFLEAPSPSAKSVG